MKPKIHPVNTGKLAPMGWHVPTEAEWATLNSYLNSGGRGFASLLGGYRYIDGTFYDIGSSGYWWSSTEDDSHDSAWGRCLAGGTGMTKTRNLKQFGYSVICVRD